MRLLSHAFSFMQTDFDTCIHHHSLALFGKEFVVYYDIHDQQYRS